LLFIFGNYEKIDENINKTVPYSPIKTAVELLFCLNGQVSDC
jgi:hypothetical protein